MDSDPIVVNEHPAFEHSGVGEIYSADRFDESREYALRASSLAGGEGEILVPIKSVGRHRKTNRVYYATDDRFLRANGFECLFPPVSAVDLDAWLSTDGTWYGCVLGPNQSVLYTTPRGSRNAGEVEEQLRAWVKRNAYSLPPSPTEDDEDEPPPTIPMSRAA